MNRIFRAWIVLVVMCGSIVDGSAQLSRNSTWEKKLKDQYDVTTNIVYCPVDSVSDRLDLYVPKAHTSPVPVLLWIHGGGWGRLSKDSVSGQIVPYLEMGWVVVNIDYRLTGAALAPAAVEDSRAALRWIYDNAKRLNADTKKIVVSGTSAGGHLALMTGMLPDGTQLDRLAQGKEPMQVAAIVNFYGITDVNDLLDGANRKGYAAKWVGDQPGREEIAKSVSPLTYVRKDLPPIISIQGDADPTVPYEHSVRLHKELEKAGVPNEHITIPGGVHGKFSKEENAMIKDKIEAFLRKNGIIEEK